MFFKPNNAGLESETRSACRRAGKLLNALGEHINENICEGTINERIRNLRLEIIDGLRDEGYRVQQTESRGWSVLPPKGTK